MPHFNAAGHETYVCQVCGTVRDAATATPTWRPDVTGSVSAGNVCPACMDAAADADAFSDTYRDFPDDTDAFDGEALDEMNREDAAGYSFEDASAAARRTQPANRPVAAPAAQRPAGFAARFPGTDAVTGHRFAAGTRIVRCPGGYTVAPGVTPAAAVKMAAHWAGPVSLEEHCRRESGGLTGVALTRYINRYYGHG